MEALTKLFIRAIDEGVVSSFPGISAIQRLSIFADDVALFVKPTHQDLFFVKAMLNMFGVASGLMVNYAKSKAIPVRGMDEDQARVSEIL